MENKFVLIPQKEVLAEDLKRDGFVRVPVVSPRGNDSLINMHYSEIKNDGKIVGFSIEVDLAVPEFNYQFSDGAFEAYFEVYKSWKTRYSKEIETKQITDEFNISQNRLIMADYKGEEESLLGVMETTMQVENAFSPISI